MAQPGTSARPPDDRARVRAIGGPWLAEIGLDAAALLDDLGRAVGGSAPA